MSAEGALSPDPVFEKRTTQEHLRLARMQIRRIPIPSAVTDFFLFWMLYRVGLALPGLAWLLMLSSVQFARWLYVVRLSRNVDLDSDLVLGRLGTFLIVLGGLRATLVLVMFSRPVQIEHQLFTMVYFGLLAGTAASVGGLFRPFAWYALLSCGTLALAWAFVGSLDGVLLCVLIVLSVVVLVANVRDQLQGLRDFVRVVCDNERLFESLKTARDQAELASQSKTRFFAAASHDLRQPLHALAINATTLEILARRQSDPMIRELSEAIHRALAQSNGLLDSLLEISNLDADAVKPRIVDVRLASLLESVREAFAALAMQKGLRLTLEVPDAGMTASTDPNLLRRVLDNLVGNAIKFTAVGGVVLRASLQKGSQTIRVTVEDSGLGIALPEQGRVFEEFYQVENISRDRSKGLGLGLSIVQRMTVLLGIDLQLHSELGRGTTVTLGIPLGSAEDTMPLSDPITGLVQAGMLVGMRVLVVDDEPEILGSLQALLRELGCEVECASGGVGAEQILQRGFSPQVLLVDHRLHGESGLDVIERIRGLVDGKLRTLLVTGDTEPAIIQAAQRSGHRVIHKPVQGAVLVQALKELGVPAG